MEPSPKPESLYENSTQIINNFFYGRIEVTGSRDKGEFTIRTQPPVIRKKSNPYADGALLTDSIYEFINDPLDETSSDTEIDPLVCKFNVTPKLNGRLLVTSINCNGRPDVKLFKEVVSEVYSVNINMVDVDFATEL